MAEDSFDTSPRISRRRAMGIGGGLVVAATLAAVGLSRSQNGVPEQEFQTVAQTEKGTIIYFTEPDTPKAYQLPGGKEVVIDPQAAKQKREKARYSGEPEIVALGKRYTESDQSQHLYYDNGQAEKQPFTSELPRDTLSEKELKSAGLIIVQAESTQLYLGSGAYETDEPFYRLSKAGRKLDIVLVDAPFLSKTAMRESKYEPYLAMLDDERNFHDAKIAKFKAEQQDPDLASVRSVLTAASKDTRINEQTGLSNRDHDILMDKLNAEFMSGLTDYEALCLMKIKGLIDNDIEGAYIKSATNPVTILAIGQSLDVGLTALYYNSRGELKVFEPDKYLPGGDILSSAPLDWQTYPQPEFFKLKPDYNPENPNSYPYGAQGAGFNLMHEVGGHAMQDLEGRPFSESDADINGAMRHITKGSLRSKNSGYKDVSGYYLRFSRPGHNGFIVT